MYVARDTPPGRSRQDRRTRRIASLRWPRPSAGTKSALTKRWLSSEIDRLAGFRRRSLSVLEGAGNLSPHHVELISAGQANPRIQIAPVRRWSDVARPAHDQGEKISWTSSNGRPVSEATRRPGDDGRPTRFGRRTGFTRRLLGGEGTAQSRSRRALQSSRALTALPATSASASGCRLRRSRSCPTFP